jgi:hypothetical protein
MDSQKYGAKSLMNTYYLKLTQVSSSSLASYMDLILSVGPF